MLGFALHAAALGAAFHLLPMTLASARYVLRGGADPSVVRWVAGLGLASLLVTVAAAWMEARKGPADTSAALARKAFVASVAAWLWTVFPQQELVVARPIVPIAIAVAAGLFSLSTLVAGIARSRARSARRLLDLGLTSLAAALIVLELGLQAASRVSAHPLLAPYAANVGDVALRALRLAPGSPHLGRRANSRGYVDEEFGDARRLPRRVVAIGDSFSIGTVPHPFHYTTVAERALGDTEILNMGAPGIGPAQYRTLLETEGLELAPDLFVVALFAGNDLEGLLREPVTAGWPWMRRRNVMLYLVWHRLTAILAERARSGASADEVELGLGRGLATGLAEQELMRELPHLADPSLESPTYSPEHFLQTESHRARTVGSPSDAEYAQLLSELELLREAAGVVPLALLLIPDEFQVDDGLWDEVLQAVEGAELERDRFQRVVLEWAAQRGVPALDLLPELRACEPWNDGRTHLYHLRDTHFNARGNRAAGEALARFLTGILPPPPAASGR